MNAALKPAQTEIPSSVFMMASAITKGYADSLHGKPASSDDEHYLKGYALQYEQGERESANQRPF